MKDNPPQGGDEPMSDMRYKISQAIISWTYDKKAQVGPERKLIGNNFDMLTDLILGIIQEHTAQARIDGFNDAKIGCSFDPDCKYCVANELTLKYLSKPESKSKTGGNS
jgi:hypothetical protein